VTSLSRHEKAAGRAFREAQQAALVASQSDSPTDLTPAPYLSVIRHSCAKRGGVSTALELREVYVWSPEYWVRGEPGSWEVLIDVPVDLVPDSGWVFVPANRFGFIYKSGRCRPCGHTARSIHGKVVDAQVRPPL
jgi:hypothetical protein